MKKTPEEVAAAAADGGLLHRRTLLASAGFGAGLALAASARDAQAADPIGLASPKSMTTPGAPFSAYGAPSKYRDEVKRLVPPGMAHTGTGASRTPLEELAGTITPAGLHFERHHNGVPDIDPERHELLIHGLVRRPLAFSVEALLRYPMESHVRFIECAGNSGGMIADQLPPTATAGQLHGLVSCSEWTGVRLSTLLDEAGVDPRGRWLLAEGADAAGMSRSVPLWKAMDDAMIALYQNGEAIRPEQGFPMRLLLPGWQGNINVKWLRRLKVMEGPTYTRDETSRYSLLMRDGTTELFNLELGPKSLILRPSPGKGLRGAGDYEISGLAWSGAGRVRTVEISVDGGRSWAKSAFNGPVSSKALTRFSLPWRWNGSPTLLMSRATDEAGQRQPTRTAWMARYAPGQSYHYNAINCWAVDPSGAVRAAHA